MISYAQNFEDVMIARLFPRDHKGFYIDVGAADPLHLSVTKHFYDAGWHGINVEPLPRFHQRLVDARPRDVNVQAVIGRKQAARTFFEIAELPENSTSDEAVMAQLKEQGRTVHTHQVEVVSLEEVCDRHVGDRQIDFMKIDVEGGELEVLQSANWRRYRPVLLVIEAVVVNGREETWAGWEHVLIEQGYEKVWFDALNNYYLRRESADLKSHFRLPPNVFDDFRQLRLEPVGSEWIDQADLLKRVDIDRRAKQEVIDRLILEVTAVAADQQAKQEVIDRLVAELQAARTALAKLATN
jgi:FkbM family methyltransferase